MTERTTGDSGDDTGENSPGQDPWRDLGITPESDEPFFDEASFDEPSFDELLFPGADTSTVNPQNPAPAVPTGKRPKAPKLRRGASSESREATPIAEPPRTEVLPVPQAHPGAEELPVAEEMPTAGHPVTRPLPHIEPVPEKTASEDITPTESFSAVPTERPAPRRPRTVATSLPPILPDGPPPVAPTPPPAAEPQATRPEEPLEPRSAFERTAGKRAVPDTSLLPEFEPPVAAEADPEAAPDVPDTAANDFSELLSGLQTDSISVVPTEPVAAEEREEGDTAEVPRRRRTYDASVPDEQDPAVLAALGVPASGILAAGDRTGEAARGPLRASAAGSGGSGGSGGGTPSGSSVPPERPSARARAIAGGVVGVVALSLLGFGTWAGLAAGGNAPSEAGPSTTPTPSEPPTEEPSPTPTPTEPTGPIRMLAMGEMVAHESVSENARTDSGFDFGPLFSELDPLLGTADATFCAQPIPSAGEAFGIAGFPQYNAPTQFATTLGDTVGCDLVSLAGPNAADRGADGIRATLDAWEATEPKIVSGTNRTPEEQRGVRYGEIRGVKTALVSFTERLNQVTDAGLVNFVGDTQLVADLITEARANADVVLVATSWGEEGTSELAQRQRLFAQQVADLGADMILGTGSHVIQPAEWLERPDGGRTLVWYSLGSLMGSPLSLPERIGAVASVELVQEGGRWTVANPTAALTYLHYAWTPEQQAANELLARTDLRAVPLAGAQALLDQDRWGTTVQAETERIAGILGPDVTVTAG